MASGSVLQKSPGSHTYSYSSQPRAAPQRRKYREDNDSNFKDDDKQVLYGNIMYDRRIVRGNTYALTYPTGAAKPDPLEQQRNQEARRRAQARRRAKEQMRIRSPDPVEGRKHIDVQTELYLEEITDRIEEADVQTQTDAFLNRPATPLFIPAKTGADVTTQIEEGDLFDFDIEVKPILEVLVGKTVEQALMEVMEEEELASLRAQQREFEENRNAELVETQRLEEQERRHREEKERRMHQQREALLKEKETSEKIAARAFAQSYLNDLVPSVFSILHDSGYFYDTTEREIETTFMPWLMEQATNALQKKIVARMLIDAMIKEVVKKKIGIKPEPSSVSENATEGTEDTSEPIRVTIEAGEDESETQADKAEPTADSQGTEEKETTAEKPTESVPDDQSNKDKTVDDKTEPKTDEQKATEEQKETGEHKEAEAQPTQPDTKTEETASSEAPPTSSEEPKAEEGKAEATTKDEEPKEQQPKDEQPKEEQPKDEPPKEEQPKDEPPKEEQPKDEPPKEEQPKDQEQPQEDTN